LKLGKATEYPVDTKDDSDLRHAWGSSAVQTALPSRKALMRVDRQFSRLMGYR
jgi:hypothetical protein